MLPSGSVFCKGFNQVRAIYVNEIILHKLKAQTNMVFFKLALLIKEFCFLNINQLILLCHTESFETPNLLIILNQNLIIFPFFLT